MYNAGSSICAAATFEMRTPPGKRRLLFKNKLLQCTIHNKVKTNTKNLTAPYQDKIRCDP